jgi:hypothetical protein
MSRPVSESIDCPACGKASPFTRWASLNVTMDPDQKEKLLSRELVRFTCPSCGETADVVYPLLYHDMQGQFLIWLLPYSPEGEPTEAPEDVSAVLGGKAFTRYRVRRVGNLNDLIEKIYIFDRGLDDGPVELLKLAVLAEMPGGLRQTETRVYFAGMDDGDAERMSFAIVSSDGTTGASVQLEPEYSKMQSLWAELAPRAGLDAPWPCVDSARVMHVMMERHAPEAPSPTPPSGKKLKPWWRVW